MKMVRGLAFAGSRVLFLLSSVGIGIGIPLFWIWIGSKLQPGTSPSLGSLLVVLAGTIVSYGVLIYVVAWVKARSGKEGIVRHAWTRSMRDTPHQADDTMLAAENAVVLAAILVAIVAGVLILVFGSPGTPQT